MNATNSHSLYASDSDCYWLGSFSSFILLSTMTNFIPCSHHCFYVFTMMNYGSWLNIIIGVVVIMSIGVSSLMRSSNAYPVHLPSSISLMIEFIP